MTNEYTPAIVTLTLDTSHYLCIITFGKISTLLIHTVLNEASYRSLAPEREACEISLSSGNLDIEHTFSHTRAGPHP